MDDGAQGETLRQFASISAEDIAGARRTLKGIATRTPILPFGGEGSVLLKAESLQPHGSFKIRCATNAVLAIPDAALGQGICTASAGNFGQGVTAAATARGVPVRVYVPDSAARTKVSAMRALSAEIAQIPFDQWWGMLNGNMPVGEARHFIHPCSGRDVVIGNATIAAEILEDVPDVEAILVPLGGGGLALGTAAAVRALAPHVEVIACEASTSTPLSAAIAAGGPVLVESDRSSFIDGAGGNSVLPLLWPLLQTYIDGVAVADYDAVSHAVATLFRRNRLVVEGAGAIPVAAALADRFAGKKVVAVVSGGNIDPDVLARILERWS